jgi:hypothetical protein
MYEAFAVYHFAEPTDPDVVYFEQDTSDLYLETLNRWNGMMPPSNVYGPRH